MWFAAAAPVDPVQGGLAAFLVTIVGIFIRMMFKYQNQDRSAGFSLADEREQDNARLRAENQLLREENAEQRTMKHASLNRLTVAQGTLDVVRALYDKCTCGALAPVGNILDRRTDPEGPTS